MFLLFKFKYSRSKVTRSKSIIEYIGNLIINNGSLKEGGHGTLGGHFLESAIKGIGIS